MFHHILTAFFSPVSLILITSQPQDCMSLPVGWTEGHSAKTWWRLEITPWTKKHEWTRISEDEFCTKSAVFHIPFFVENSFSIFKPFSNVSCSLNWANLVLEIWTVQTKNNYSLLTVCGSFAWNFSRSWNKKIKHFITYSGKILKNILIILFFLVLTLLKTT